MTGISQDGLETKEEYVGSLDVGAGDVVAETATDANLELVKQELRKLNWRMVHKLGQIDKRSNCIVLPEQYRYFFQFQGEVDDFILHKNFRSADEISNFIRQCREMLIKTEAMLVADASIDAIKIPEIFGGVSQELILEQTSYNNDEFNRLKKAYVTSEDDEEKNKYFSCLDRLEELRQKLKAAILPYKKHKRLNDELKNIRKEIKTFTKKLDGEKKPSFEEVKDFLLSKRKYFYEIQYLRFRALVKEKFSGTNSDGCKMILRLANDSKLNDSYVFGRACKAAYFRLNPGGDYGFFAKRYRESDIFGKGRHPNVEKLYRILANIYEFGERSNCDVQLNQAIELMAKSNFTVFTKKEPITPIFRI